MTERFDVAVIGTGTSAYHVVHAASAAGKRVVVIDELPYGGTCAMRGCQPKKYLVAAAGAVHAARHLDGIGVSGTTALDWDALQANKNLFVDAVPAGSQGGFEQAGAVTLRGRARFVGPTTLAVGERTLEADRIVVATGARPRPLGIPGEELMTSSTGFLDLASMPREIVFVGGGYISFEFAFVARAAGATVTILQRGARPLKQFDPVIVEALVAAAEDAGIAVHTNSCVDRVERRDGRLVVRCDAEGTEYVADAVVHGAGRVPNVDDLGLDAAGVEFTRAGITVSASMRSVSNPAVYAIGDVAATPYQLATTADAEGKAVARSLSEPGGEEAGHEPGLRVVPSVAFTEPPVATVGLREDEARARGLPVRVKSGSMTGWPSSKRIGQKHAVYKTVVHEETDQILGAHLLGHGMDEAINLFAVAIECKMTATRFRELPWAYPTYGSDMKYTV